MRKTSRTTHEALWLTMASEIDPQHHAVCSTNTFNTINVCLTSLRYYIFPSTLHLLTHYRYV